MVARDQAEPLDRVPPDVLSSLLFDVWQTLVYGDNRPYCVALVFPDWELLTSWAETKANAKPGASKEEIASMPAVRNLVAGEMQLALEGFKKFEVSVDLWFGDRQTDRQMKQTDG